MTIRNHPNRRHALGLCLATLALAAAPETATPSATPTAEPRIYLPWGSKP